jgi:hypothetical protein
MLEHTAIGKIAGEPKGVADSSPGRRLRRAIDTSSSRFGQTFCRARPPSAISAYMQYQATTTYLNVIVHHRRLK